MLWSPAHSGRSRPDSVRQEGGGSPAGDQPDLPLSRDRRARDPGERKLICRTVAVPTLVKPRCYIFQKRQRWENQSRSLSSHSVSFFSDDEQSVGLGVG